MNIDKIIFSARKSIVLCVTPSGELIIRAPYKTDKKFIAELVQKKSQWILDKQQKAQLNYKKLAPKKFLAGEHFLFLGKTFPLKIVTNAKKILTFNEEFCLQQNFTATAELHFTHWYKEEAKKLIHTLANKYANKHNLRFNKLSINSAKQRFGSCNSSGNLNFTWRLIMAPIEVIEYVVVHELAHLEHLNHSKAFWDTVKTMLPDYQQHNRWLKENGRTLTL